MKARRTLLAILLVSALAPALISAETLVKPETATPVETCPSCKEVRVLLVPDDKCQPDNHAFASHSWRSLSVGEENDRE